MLSYLRIHTCRQTENEIGTGYMKGFGKLLIGSHGIGKKKIIANGSAHQRITLLYIHDMRTHAGSFCLFAQGIIQYYPSAIGLDDTRQETQMVVLPQPVSPTIATDVAGRKS